MRKLILFIIVPLLVVVFIIWAAFSNLGIQTRPDAQTFSLGAIFNFDRGALEKGYVKYFGTWSCSFGFGFGGGGCRSGIWYEISEFKEVPPSECFLKWLREPILSEKHPLYDIECKIQGDPYNVHYYPGLYFVDIMHRNPNDFADFLEERGYTLPTREAPSIKIIQRY